MINQPTIDTTIVQSSQPVLWYVIRVNSRKHTETNDRTVNAMTIFLHSGPRLSALRAASSSGVNWSMANQSARKELRLPIAKVG